MPVMNGVEFLKRVKLRSRRPPVKALVLSNLSDPIGRDDLQAYGVTKIVLKADLSPAQLAQTVQTMLAEKKVS
jgi:DNA-binding NarL/FixJ family response regulator